MSSIAVPTTVLLQRGWLAHERSIRSVLLLSISPFAGPGEHSIQPTLWDASPGFVRSPACQALLPLWFFSCTHSPTLYFCSLSQEYTVRGGRDTKPQTVRPIKSIAHASRAAREGRRRSRGASFDTALARARVAWLLERDQEIFRALTDRASGRTLVGRHAGSMPPSRVVLGHAVVVSGPFCPPSSSFDIPR